jgi:hypothetical protein
MDESPNLDENEDPRARLAIFRCSDEKKSYRGSATLVCLVGETAGGALKLRLLMLNNKQEDDNLTLSDKHLHAGL